MTRETLYPTRDREYKVAGWLGAISIMRELGGSVLESEAQSRSLENPKHTIDFTLLFSTLLHQKPHEYLDTLQEWLAADADYMQRGALKNLGIVSSEFGDPVVDPNFIEAMTYLIDPDVQEYVHKYTDFERLLPEIEIQADFFARVLADRVDRDHTAYGVAHREIDFYVGFSESLATLAEDNQD